MELFKNSDLKDIVLKIENSERLTKEDGYRLMNSKDLLTIGYMADLVRRRKNGDNTFFVVNRHINHTNICKTRCKLCAFGVDADSPSAYLMTLDDVEQRAIESQKDKISEIHIVGGLNPDLGLDYFMEMLQRVSRALPGVHIKAFTAVEIDHFAETYGIPVVEVLRKLKSAGLGSLPGGGAEIFSPRVREIICPDKVSGERWLEIMEAVHSLGMPSNATMLYGHVETPEERIEHLIKLRELQDKTGGFQTFIPLAFHPKNTALEDMKLGRTTGYEDLKVLAISRLMLDNFDHIKAYWVMIGPKLAQVALAFGVDDLDGTVTEERITNAAGGEAGQALTKKELIKMIKAAGRIPLERDTLYNVINKGF